MIMTQEEKELLLKDLCARLPYGVKVNNEIQGDFNIYGICENFVFGRNEVCHVDFDVEKIKPYLFPLSSMTEEQKKQLKQYTCPNGTGYFDGYSLCCPINHFGENIPFEFMARIINWLIKNHFDYCGLISMGLAIDATGLNIY